MAPKLTLILFFSLCVLYVENVQGVDIDAAKEQSCSQSEGFVTKHFKNWIAEKNVTTLYLPMLSKLDVIRITQSLLKSTDVSQIRKRDIDQSCITVHPGDGVFVFSGYCGLKATKHLTMTKPLVFNAPPTFTGDQSTAIHVSLMDAQETWQVVEVCWGDNQRSFAVLSALPTLSACDQRLIRSHLMAIGYKEEFFYGLRYEDCPFICAAAAGARAMFHPAGF